MASVGVVRLRCEKSFLLIFVLFKFIEVIRGVVGCKSLGYVVGNFFFYGGDLFLFLDS